MHPKNGMMTELYESNMKTLFFLTLLSLTSISIADTMCKGKIEYMGIGRSGVLLVKGPGGLPATYLCNTEVEMNNVKPSACKAAHGMLLAAKIADKDVSVTFNPNITS